MVSSKAIITSLLKYKDICHLKYKDNYHKADSSV